jgi:hypothetical protein
MALARDIMRATIRARREQERRNFEAIAEELERQEAVPGYKPPERKMMRVGSPENKMAENPVEVDIDFTGPRVRADDVRRVVKEAMQEVENPLADVPWASPQAYARAVNHGLMPLAFLGQEFTGRSGFTAADVARIAKELGR